ncbi:MAG: hypothetical protein ACJARR_000407 [Pseudophaeobacter arcticus]|jgi:hypothetical protein
MTKGSIAFAFASPVFPERVFFTKCFLIVCVSQNFVGGDMTKTEVIA